MNKFKRGDWAVANEYGRTDIAVGTAYQVMSSYVTVEGEERIHFIDDGGDARSRPAAGYSHAVPEQFLVTCAAIVFNSQEEAEAYILKEYTHDVNVTISKLVRKVAVKRTTVETLETVE